MRKLPLEQRKKSSKKQHAWISCPPFVDNSRGTLIHRPREGMTYNLHPRPHIGIGFWCGMHIATDWERVTFQDSPPEGKILCERCEAAAVKAGQPSSYELTGRHIHIGRTKAVVTCCEAIGD